MSKGRFIAGAVCQSCGSQDTLRLIQEAEKKTFECVACGYKEVMMSQQKTVKKQKASSFKDNQNIIQWLPNND